MPIDFQQDTRFPGRRENTLAEKLAKLAWILTFLVSVFLAAKMVSGIGAVLTGVVIFSSCFLVRKTAAPFDLGRLSITSFWYVTYLAMIFFPAFFVFADQELHPSRVPYLFSVESVLITVPLGFLIAAKLLSFKSQETDSYFSQPLELSQINRSLEKRFIFLLGIAILFTGLYMREVGTIPLFYLLHNPGDYLAAFSLREDSFKLLNSHFEYVYFLLRGTLYPVLTACAYGCYKVTRQLKWKIMFFLSLGASIFFASLSLAKAPVAMIFVTLAFFIYFYQRRVISMRKVVVFFCLIFLFPIAIVFQSGKNLGIAEVSVAIGERLLYSPSEVVYYYFEVFPGHVNYLHGRSIGKLAWLFGEDYFDTPNYVGRYGFPQYQETINANGAFIGDLNADFGLWGVLLGGIIAGGVMQIVHIYFVRRKRTVCALACYAFILYAFWFLNSTSLPTALASNGVLFSIALLWFLESVPTRPSIASVVHLVSVDA